MLDIRANYKNRCGNELRRPFGLEHEETFDDRQTRILVINECFFLCYFMHFDPTSSQI